MVGGVGRGLEAEPGLRPHRAPSLRSGRGKRGGGGGDAAATVSAGRRSGAGLAPAQLFRLPVAPWARAVGGLPPRPSLGAPREPQDPGLCLGASRCDPSPQRPSPSSLLSPPPPTFLSLSLFLGLYLLSPPDSLPSSPWIS